jgi:hypothetical protein
MNGVTDVRQLIVFCAAKITRNSGAPDAAAEFAPIQ